MKTSAIVCAVLAGTFGLSSIASAQPWGDREHERGDRGQRFEQRAEPRFEQRAEPRHQPRVENYGAWRGDRYAYAEPGRHHFYRGGYLPREYLRGPYYVSNWNAYPGLYAPPYGYQWVNVDGQFLLVALATGLIANTLINSY